MIWAVSGGKVILEVEKITSDTYAGETTYTGESFILLDIYPKTNGTVKVTYGGLTKTITDTSGAAEPNAQQMYFGTFNGVSDSVATPASGDLTIEGDCDAFGCGSYNKSSKLSTIYTGVIAINSFGNTSKIPDYAFSKSAYFCALTSVTIPSNIKSVGAYSFMVYVLETVVIENGVESIGARAFMSTNLTEVIVPSSVKSIVDNPFQITGNNIVIVDGGNLSYKVDGNGLIEIATNKLVSGFANTVIPSYVTEIGSYAFAGQSAFTSITIPAQIKRIGNSAYWITVLTNVTVLATEPPTISDGIFYYNSADGTYPTITVPKGCGDKYKAADGWSTYADFIVEAS